MKKKTLVFLFLFLIPALSYARDYGLVDLKKVNPDISDWPDKYTIPSDYRLGNWQSTI